VDLVGTIVAAIIGIPVWLWSQERLHHVWICHDAQAMPSPALRRRLAGQRTTTPTSLAADGHSKR
jgi:hypothetical protein